jgi:hypothetical protein
MGEFIKIFIIARKRQRRRECTIERERLTSRVRTA